MTKTEAASIREGVRVVLDRRLIAFDNFIALIADIAPSIDAPAVAGLYLKKKLMKFTGTAYMVKHGALLDQDVLEGANKSLSA